MARRAAEEARDPFPTPLPAGLKRIFQEIIRSTPQKAGRKCNNALSLRGLRQKAARNS
jgi:hypothetical protein